MKSSYGSRELIKCLSKLGFTEQPQVGSRHLKYTCSKPTEKGKRNFIVVLQAKTSYDPYTCKKIMKQIENLGYTREEVEKAFE